MSVPATVTAGTAVNFTVTALDTYNNTATGYSGTAKFSTSDTSATLQANGSLVAGVGVFSVTLKQAGVQSLTATDSLTSSINGTFTGIAVKAAAASTFAVVGSPTSVIAGNSVTFTVTAVDTYGNIATGYTGTVGFTTSDTLATPPANSTLINGVGTFSEMLIKAGNQTLTATDTTTGSINGTSNAVSVTAAAATQLIVSGSPSTVTAGNAASFTVTADDTFGNTATGYNGTVHFTSSDTLATLPANSTLSNGSKIFSVNLKKAGSQTLTATDTVTSFLANSSNAISVTPAATSSFAITGAPSSIAAGNAFLVTVTAYDTYGNLTPGYSGTLHFTSTDAKATLPVDSTLSAGTAAFTATLKTAGNQTLTATDKTSSSINGSSVISVTPGAATQFAVTGSPGTVTAGGNVALTVTAEDTYGNTATGYTGTASFTLSDPQAAALANSTLTSGKIIFSSVTLKTAGPQTLSAADASNGTINGTSNTITVSAAAASHFSVTGSPTSVTAGANVTFTVTALDTFGNTATGYTGTVHFTTTDTLATPPADSTLVSGTKTFGVALKRVGSQTLTATDSANGTISGISNAISVAPRGRAFCCHRHPKLRHGRLQRHPDRHCPGFVQQHRNGLHGHRRLHHYRSAGADVAFHYARKRCGHDQRDTQNSRPRYGLRHRYHNEHHQWHQQLYYGESRRCHPLRGRCAEPALWRASSLSWRLWPRIRSTISQAVIPVSSLSPPPTPWQARRAPPHSPPASVRSTPR